MKNKVILYVLLLALVPVSSCKKYFEDDVVSPNDPEKVSAALLLTGSEVATFATFGGQLARQTSIFTQQAAGTSAGSQSIEFAQYNITELSNVNEWDGIYGGAIVNAKLIVTEYGAGSPYYAGMAQVIMAMNFGLATDLWGDVPFSKAGNGLSGETAPSYDSQQATIAGIQTLLDQAIANFARPASDNTFLPGGDDLIFNGDVSLWTKTAYILKARYANRLSKRDAAGSAAQALQYLAAAGSLSTAEDAQMKFGGSTSLNQWYAFESSRANYVKAGKTYVDMLVANNDPRLPFFISKDADGNYSGTAANDLDNIESSYVGPYYASADSPIPLVSAVEAFFIEAEARFRSGDLAGAAIAYNNAVTQSVTQVTGAAPPAPFILQFASATAGTISMNSIMTQKYIAMFIQVESYSDWRRTGIPALTPNPDAVNPAIPRRLPTPQSERLYNPNATVVGSTTSPVWWDQ